MICKNCNKEFKEKNNTQIYCSIQCRKKFNEKATYRRRIKEDPIFNRKMNLRWKYNISWDEYLKLYQQQHGKCAICGKQEEFLITDHDHKNGRIRGLLCQLCNSGIGFLKDDIKILKKAIYYLNRKNNGRN
jgi:hypothetical protein